MKSKVVLQGVILCALLLFGLIEAQDGSGSRNSRRRRCRCKKYINQLNVDINKRLSDFEARFELYFSQSMDDISNKTQNALSEASDRALNSISNDFNTTSQILKLENYTLKKMQQNIRSQKVTVDTLNANFKELDAIVRNLSAVVERLEETLKNNAEFSHPQQLTQGNKRNRKRKQKPTTPPPPVYPKGKTCLSIIIELECRFLKEKKTKFKKLLTVDEECHRLIRGTVFVSFITSSLSGTQNQVVARILRK